MECIACTRSDSARQYYCTNCLKARLLEHQARKQQLRNALTLQSNRASNLLLHGPTPTTNQSRSRPLGVREESELKAERWTLSVRLRDTRIATEQEKSKVEILASEVQKRRNALSARRANLSTARSLLTSLSTPSLPTSPSLPLSLSSLNSQISQLSHSLSTLSDSLARVRRILTLEFLTTYSFKTLETPLPDPFLQHPSSNPSPSTPFPPSYTLATLPLPSLSLLPTLPSQTLEALLTNLAHLTRLLALYEGIALPFVPLPNFYGPGKAGIRSSPGCQGWDGIVSSEIGLNEEEDGNEQDQEIATTMISCFPLGFGVGEKVVKSARNGVEPDSEGMGEIAEKLRESSGRRREPSGSRRDGVDSTMSSSRRLKLVMKGAIALAYDLGYISWIRESRGSEVGEAADWGSEDLEDLGKLILRAAGAESEEDRALRKKSRSAAKESSTLDDVDPFPTSDELAASQASIATLQPPLTQIDPHSPEIFPLSFPPVSQCFLSLAFPSPASTSPSKRGKKRSKNGESSTIGRGTRMGESSFVDAGISTMRLGGDDEDDDEGEEEEEEWDFV